MLIHQRDEGNRRMEQIHCQASDPVKSLFRRCIQYIKAPQCQDTSLFRVLHGRAPNLTEHYQSSA